MPTIFSFSEGKEQQPRRSLVSINVQVSDSEEVADVQNGSCASSLAANQSNVMMEDTPELAFADIVHDDIALTANVDLSSSTQPNILIGNQFISTECASLLDGLDDVPQEILQRIQKKKNAFSENLKQFATTLHFYSPKAYDYVRENLHLALPHPQTIRRWYSSISADPGFTVASFTALKSHVDEKKKKQEKKQFAP